MSIGCSLGGPHDVPYKADEIAVGASTVDFTPCCKSVLDAMWDLFAANAADKSVWYSLDRDRLASLREALGS